MSQKLRDAYIVDGTRTPFIKAKTGPNPFSNSDLAVAAGRQLLLKQAFPVSAIDNVVIGSTIPNPNEPNVARIIGLRLGLDESVPAWTVMRNCASGLQALDSAAQQIQSGRSDLVLAGGTDAMSQAPLLFNQAMTRWFAAFASAKSMTQKLALLPKVRPHFLAPVISILKGLTDPIVCMNMGQTAEELAYLFDINRREMDAFAVDSHMRLAHAQDKGLISEIVPLYDNKGHVYDKDDGLRRDSTVEKLAKLKPFFDKKFGMVTAGNSSQITDGAAMLILASADAVKKYKLPVLARVVDANWAGLDPRVMGLGPVHSIVPMLERNKLSVKDVDYWEINEAFAAQVIACQKATNSDTFCKEHFKLAKAFGEIQHDRLNVDGGAISIGHPVGASGARITLRLAHILKREKSQYGVASLCIGGGQGGAMLIENVDEVHG